CEVGAGDAAAMPRIALFSPCALARFPPPPRLRSHPRAAGAIGRAGAGPGRARAVVNPWPAAVTARRGRISRAPGPPTGAGPQPRDRPGNLRRAAAPRAERTPPSAERRLGPLALPGPLRVGQRDQEAVAEL